MADGVVGAVNRRQSPDSDAGAWQPIASDTAGWQPVNPSAIVAVGARRYGRGSRTKGRLAVREPSDVSQVDPAGLLLAAVALTSASLLGGGRGPLLTRSSLSS
jgi:hypothetical protein